MGKDEKRLPGGPKIIQRVNQQLGQSMDKIAAQKGRSDLMLLNTINNQFQEVGELLKQLAEENLTQFEEITRLRAQVAELQDVLAKEGEKQKTKNK